MAAQAGRGKKKEASADQGGTDHKLVLAAGGGGPTYLIENLLQVVQTGDGIIDASSMGTNLNSNDQQHGPSTKILGSNNSVSNVDSRQGSTDIQAAGSAVSVGSQRSQTTTPRLVLAAVLALAGVAVTWAGYGEGAIDAQISLGGLKFEGKHLGIGALLVVGAIAVAVRQPSEKKLPPSS